MNSKNFSIFLHLLFCLSTCILSIMDSSNTWEYIFYADKSTKFLNYILPFFAILHLIALFLYNLICLFYLYYLDDIDFENILLEKEFYEMIYFRKKIKNHSILILPLSIWLTIISYTKFFSFYSMKFLIESPFSFEIFFNVITTTLYNPIIIQIICQTFPMLILQILNNLMNEEHSHSFHLRGVVNFSTIISTCFIINSIFLYLRDKNKIIDKQYNDKSKFNNYQNTESLSQLSSTEISCISSVEIPVNIQ